MNRWVCGPVSLLWFLAMATLGGSGPAHAAGKPADEAEIATVIDNSIGWFKNKNFDLLFSTLADDAELFIFHPDSKSTIRGAEAFREFSEFFRSPDLTYAGHEIRDLSIHTSHTRKTAWFSALLNDCSEFKGKKSCWNDCRWTGVLEKRGGRWVIVQMHFSFAADLVAVEARQAAGTQPSRREFGSYQEMRSAVVELYGQQRYAEAAAILTDAVDRYPDNIMANTFNLALMYASMDSLDAAVRALEDGHRRGIFYGKWSFQGAPWEKLGDRAGFQRVLARNQELIAEAEQKTAMKLEVVTPPGYEPGRKYPLFIALHGGGENLSQFKPHWTSPRLRQEFIVAYVQSSQVASMDGYHWQDDDVTRRDLDQAYREVVAKYSVDTHRVLVGGFSSGGYATLTALLEGKLPAVGFIVLCPEVPADPSQDALDKAARRGIRGTLLTTELDGRLERQKQYVARLTANGLEVRFLVTPNVGHWYPDDLERLIDEALEHIGQKRRRT